MSYNRFLRWVASILGIIGRSVGLSRIPFLQELYLQAARFFLPDADVWVPIDGQKIRLPSPRRNVLSRMVYLYGDWESPVTQTLRKEIHPGMTTLDIGAHIGFYTLIMAQNVGKDGRVFAFEPNPEVQGYLRENILQNGYPNVIVCPVALFREEGFGVMKGHDSLIASLSPLPVESGGKIPMRVYDRIAAPLGIGRVDLIKMDVEGAELDILFGMKELLERDHPSLVIEVHKLLLKKFGYSDADLFDYLTSFGFSFTAILRQVETTTVFCSRKAAAGLIPAPRRPT
jgi:FkbM family methyltransferase